MPLPIGLPEDLRRVLGDQAAEKMMSWMDDVDARRTDAGQLRESIRADFAEFRETMRGDFAEFRETMRGDFAELRHEFADLRQEMRDGDGKLREEMRDGDGKLREEIKQAKYDLIKWSFVFWVSAIASIAALAQVLR